VTARPEPLSDARTRTPPSVALVVNTHSRAGAEAYRRVHARLVARGMRMVAGHAVRDPERLGALIARLVDEGCDAVAVGGGDGTLRSAVGLFAGRDTVLGVIPVGTANSFARALGVPLDAEAAADVIADGRIARVDVGRIDERYFAATAAIGVPSAVSADMPPRLKRWLGPASYALVGAMKLLAARPFRCTVRWSGGETTYATLDVLVANAPYQGGVAMANPAQVDSGELVVRIIAGTSRWRLLRVWLSPRRADPPDLPYVKVLRGAAFEITTQPSRRVNVDGELVARTPIRVSVAPGALRVFVPRDGTSGAV
jgi:YegS/Rv2252/BmrU family lipid kinase